MIESTRKEFATIIQKNTEELMQLVNDVLDLSRLEANMMKFQIHEYDVVSLCNDAIYMARMKGEGYIDILFKTDIPMQNIITDTARLTQTLLDLLTYPDRCNKQREITFTLSRDVDTCPYCQFPVGRSGIHISKSQYPTRHQSFTFGTFRRKLYCQHR